MAKMKKLMKARKITVEMVVKKLAKLRAETGLQMGIEVLQKESVYKILLTTGIGQERFFLFGRGLTTREAAMAIDMLILARQLNWSMPSQQPAIWARLKNGWAMVNYDIV